jgi:hypothetical protein
MAVKRKVKIPRYVNYAINFNRWKQWREWFMSLDGESLFEVEIRRLTFREARDEVERAAIKEAILALEGIEYRFNAARRFNQIYGTGLSKAGSGTEQSSVPRVRE